MGRRRKPPPPRPRREWPPRPSVLPCAVALPPASCCSSGEAGSTCGRPPGSVGSDWLRPIERGGLRRRCTCRWSSSSSSSPSSASPCVPSPAELTDAPSSTPTSCAANGRLGECVCRCTRLSERVDEGGRVFLARCGSGNGAGTDDADKPGCDADGAKNCSRWTCDGCAAESGPPPAPSTAPNLRVTFGAVGSAGVCGGLRLVTACSASS